MPEHASLQSPAPRGRPVTIAVLNDYHVVIEGIVEMLRPWRDQLVVTEANVRSPLRRGVDIALYDTFGQEAAELARVSEQLRAARVGHTVVYSWMVDDESTQVLLRQGASGVVSKRLPARELAEALLRVAAGETVVAAGPSSRSNLQTGIGRWPGQGHDLSPREAEMVSMICQELTNEQIVDLTGLSINTVKSYIRTAYRKMGVTRRAEAVRWGFAHGMDPDTPGSELLADPDAQAGA